VTFVPDEGNDHAVEIEKEHDQVEAELDEGFLVTAVSRLCYAFEWYEEQNRDPAYLFVYIQLPENLRRIQ
jgi:hypothetical protein